MKFGGPYTEVEGWEFKRLAGAFRKRFGPETFLRYFRIINFNTMDFCIFQLNIRYPLPVMDLLYLEYLNRLVQDGAIRELVIISFQDHRLPAQQVDVWEKHKQNIEGIFGNNLNCIRIINGEESLKEENASELMSKEFSDLIKYVSNDFLRRPIKEVFNINVRHFSKFNRFYPEMERLECLYNHLSRSYLAWRYLLSSGVIPSKSSVVGYLVWETEVDKLGVYHKMVVQKGRYRLCAILGKTVKGIPNFEEEKTIYLYDTYERTIEKLNKKSAAELRRYVPLLRTILRENYPTVLSNVKLADVAINRLPSAATPKNQTARDILAYLEILRDIYNRQRERIKHLPDIKSSSNKSFPLPELSWLSVTWTFQPFVINHRERRKEDAQKASQLHPRRESLHSQTSPDRPRADLGTL